MTLTSHAFGSLAALALVALSLPVSAADYYVDAATGSDANGGTGPSDAWRTLTHAVVAVPLPGPTETHVLHVAAGLYDAAGGEVFPLEMRPRLQLVGAGEPQDVVLSGTGSGALVRFTSSLAGDGWGFDEASLLRGLTLRHAGTGVSLGSDWLTVGPRLEDLHITDMTGAGVAASCAGFGGAGAFAPVLERVVIQRASPCLSASNFSNGGSSSVRLVDCVLRDGPGDGIRLVSAGGNSGLALNGLRVSVRRHGGDSLRFEYTNGSTGAVHLDACELIDSAGHGLYVPIDNGLGGIVSVELRACTVSGHALSGLGVAQDTFNLFANHPTRLDSTILYGNGDDLVETPGDPSVQQVVNCDIGDGDYLGVTGTFAADPRFVAPDRHDYRLRFGSPCIDRGSPGLLAPGEASLGGFAPPLDGDLDLVAAADVGAREFAPLQLAGKPVLGATVELECWGPTGAVARVFWSRGPLLAAPQVLPFGEQWLAQPMGLALVATGANAPGTVALPLPANPSWSGVTFGFQALAGTLSGAPLPQVLTNPLEMTVR
ncbi:MAG: DUF1565 domain-containing protein [Planctomycetes bacterium]|nr:DUF1565 domain-containing protein [Planctomycetota bacterium]